MNTQSNWLIRVLIWSSYLAKISLHRWAETEAEEENKKLQVYFLARHLANPMLGVLPLSSNS
jgi:hypothetical protein